MRSIPSPPRRSVILVALVTFVLLFLYSTSNPSFPAIRVPGHRNTEPLCLDRPIAQDVVLVIKTGASELPARLPVLLEKNFKCAPNILVFSDTEQEFQGTHIYDALDELESTINNASDPDSIYHQTLREAYRDGKSLDLDREAAWKIDRFKNIPMLKKAYKMRPLGKWYVFIDADTWFLWDNLLHFLGRLDSRKPMYLGSPVNGSDELVFAHGGSGYIVSRVAARALVEAPEEANKRYFQSQKEECCGDIVLGRALRDRGVFLTPAFPSFQGENLDGLAFDLDYWCHAALTFHHMGAEDLAEVQKIMDSAFKHTSPRYADIFDKFIWPQLKANNVRTNWDSNSRTSVFERKSEDPASTIDQPYDSLENCRSTCESDEDCLQLTFRDGFCGLSKYPRLGYVAKDNITSEWMVERIGKYKRKHSGCEIKWTS